MENDDNRLKKSPAVYSKTIRAGRRRTYFFDVRTTKSNDYYITLTESKKKFNEDGYDRHKIFLYKEDFNKFIEALNETVNHVKTDLLPEYDFDEFNNREFDEEEGDFHDDEGRHEGGEHRPREHKPHTRHEHRGDHRPEHKREDKPKADTDHTPEAKAEEAPAAKVIEPIAPTTPAEDDFKDEDLKW